MWEYGIQAQAKYIAGACVRWRWRRWWCWLPGRGWLAATLAQRRAGSGASQAAAGVEWVGAVATLGW